MEVSFMRGFHSLLATIMVLAAFSSAIGADKDDDPQLSPEQNKRFKELKTSLAAPSPLNPAEAEKQLQDVQIGLTRFLSVNNQPSTQSTSTLATTLVQGLNTGRVSWAQTVQLTKALSRALDLKSISYQDTNQFVRQIEPVVNQTGLGFSERMRLYREALMILRTAPTYSPR
jgi:hypothetical protein